MFFSRVALLTLCALAAAPCLARADGPPLAFFGGLGGGGSAAGSPGDATRGGLFEAELGAGLELAAGLRPEAALVVGLAPRAFLGMRPGLRWALDGLPFHLRGALDFAAPGGSWRLRWLLGGAGSEVRITDQLGLYGEADLGLPIASKAGVAFLLRAGATFRY